MGLGRVGMVVRMVAVWEVHACSCSHGDGGVHASPCSRGEVCMRWVVHASPCCFFSGKSAAVGSSGGSKPRGSSCSKKKVGGDKRFEAPKNSGIESPLDSFSQNLKIPEKKSSLVGHFSVSWPRARGKRKSNCKRLGKRFPSGLKAQKIRNWYFKRNSELLSKSFQLYSSFLAIPGCFGPEQGEERKRPLKEDSEPIFLQSKDSENSKLEFQRHL